MNSDTFNRLSQLFGTSRSRRAALVGFLGTALMGTAPVNAAKVASDGTSKRGGKGHRKHAKKRRGVGGQATDGNHCITPDGADLNTIYGVSAQIVTGFCPQVGSGEQWVSSGAPWSMNTTFKAVPKDFVPAGETPLQDFVAKFQGVKYVIDPGTSQEQTVVFPNTSALFVGSGAQFPSTPDDWVVVSPMTLGTLAPLPVGAHVVDVSWVFSAMHCDGLGKKIADNCLPAGEVPYNVGRGFEVTAGHS